MQPSWVTMQCIESFGAYSMGEPLNNQLGHSTTFTAPITATNFNLKSSECVVGTITTFPVTQPSSVQQNNFSSSQLVAANRTIHSLHK